MSKEEFEMEDEVVTKARKEKKEKKEKKSKKDKVLKDGGAELRLQRLEIIMSQSIEEDFVSAFMKEDTGRMFTKLPVVMGRGVTDPKMGDAVWPQLNCMYIIICTKEQAAVVKDIVARLHQEYPKEGLACFTSKVKML